MKKYLISAAAYATIEIEAESEQEAEDKAYAASISEWEVVGISEEDDFYTEELEDGTND